MNQRKKKTQSLADFQQRPQRGSVQPKNSNAKSSPKPPSHNRFNVTLKRKVTVERYPMIAEICLLRPREDLVTLLKSMETSTKEMPKRLTDYLARQQLWDKATRTLTKKGEELVQSGLFPVIERGLYHIWFTNEDPLLGTRPLMVQRDTSQGEPRDFREWQNGWDAEHSEFSLNKAEQNEIKITLLEAVYEGGQKSKIKPVDLKIQSLKPQVIGSNQEYSEINLTWKLDLQHSTCQLTGQLDCIDFQSKNKSSKLETLELELDSFQSLFDSLMHSVSKKLDGHWESEYASVACPLNYVSDEKNAAQTFNITHWQQNHFDSEFGQFDSIEIHQLPVKPIDQQDAERWHHFWLEQFYQQPYQSSIAAKRAQGEWLDHSALQAFELPLNTSLTLLDAISKEGYPEAYWHIAAMADLSPTQSKKQQLPFTLTDEQTVKFRDFVSRLTTGENLRQVIYSDRYVHTNKQSRNLRSIANYCNQASGLLMTLEPQKGKEATLPEKWHREVFEKEHNNHGRYWVLIGNANIYCWECTSGLDFIESDAADNEFIVKGTPSFTPKSLNELPDYLQKKVTMIKNKGIE